MKKWNDKRIVFMGTPDFAVASLKALVDEGFPVVAVITSADKPAGRGRQLQMSAVKKYALEKQIPVLQPTNLKSEGFLAELKAYKADLQIVVAFRMLPEIVWAMPSLGTFNLHASLLPQYRGAAPINWAIINGETETGLSTFFIQQEIDTGKILFAQKLDILPEDNAGSLHDKLMETGAKLVCETADAIFSGNIHPMEQIMPQDGQLKSAPKIFKEDCQINWNWPARRINLFIRGLSPYPAAFTYFKHKQTKERLLVKIFESELISHARQSKISLNVLAKKEIIVHLSDSIIKLNAIQVEGKKRMSNDELLRGFSLEQYELEVD